MALLDDEEGGEDEFERETSLFLLQISAIKTFEALHLAKQEIDILEHMVQLMSENNGQLPTPVAPEPVLTSLLSPHISSDLLNR
jgi:hypothetical protein